MKQLNVFGKNYELHWVNGGVASSGKNLETIVRGGGGGGYVSGGTGYAAPVNITSKTVVHDQVFVIDGEGREHAFQLSGFDLACREGNELLVIWAVAAGKSLNRYLIVYNRTTGKTYFNKASIRQVFRPHWIFPVGLSVILLSVKLYFWILFVFGLWYLFTLRGARKFTRSFDPEIYR